MLGVKITVNFLFSSLVYTLRKDIFVTIILFWENKQDNLDVVNKNKV